MFPDEVNPLMARQGYQEQLDQLREDVLYMSEVVTEALRLEIGRAHV